MRIAHVSEVTTGGVAAMLSSVVPGQVRAGHEVTVCMPTRLDAVPPEVFARWDVRRRGRDLGQSVKQLRRLVTTLRPDVVHLHSFVAGALGRTGLRGPAFGGALVYQPHSWDYRAARHPASLGTLVAVEAALGRCTDTVVVNCREEAAEGKRHGVSVPTVVVGLPVDLARFLPPSPAEQASARRRVAPGGRRVAVVVGDLCWQKGHDRLVAAWEQSPVPDTDLVLVGGYQPRRLRPFVASELARLAPSQWGTTIRAVGHQEDVRPWLHAADLVIMASLYESASVALGEALASGTPVVTTDFAGATEAVVEGPEEPAGVVLRGSADRDDLASRLVAECGVLLRQPALRARHARAARLRAERVYAPGAVLDRLDVAYDHAVTRRRRGR